jgi:hypothetical protein
MRRNDARRIVGHLYRSNPQMAVSLGKHLHTLVGWNRWSLSARGTAVFCGHVAGKPDLSVRLPPMSLRTAVGSSLHQTFCQYVAGTALSGDIE